MVAFSVPTHVEQLVLHSSAAVTVQAQDQVLESFPLGLFVLGVEFRVGLVSTVDQTEIHGGLKIESGVSWSWFEEGTHAHGLI